MSSKVVYRFFRCLFLARFSCEIAAVVIMTGTVGGATVTQAEGVAQGIDIGVNGDGVGLSFALRDGTFPAFSFHEHGTGRVKYLEYNGTQWVSSVVDGSLNTVPMTVVDPELTEPSSTALLFFGGAPHVFYFHAGENALRHGYFSGGTWHTEVIDSSANTGGSPAATICGSQLCVSYYDKIQGDLRFAQGITGSWTTTTVDRSGDQVGAMSSITTGPGGEISIAYYDATNKRLKFARRMTSWIIESVTDYGRKFGLFPSIVIGPDGVVHISSSRYRPANSVIELGVYYTRKVPGGGWSLVPIDKDFSGGATVLKLNAEGRPIVLYQRKQTSATLRNAMSIELSELQASGVWTKESIASSSDSGVVYSYAHLGLELTTAGVPQVGYHFRRSPSGADPEFRAIRLHGGSGGTSGDSRGSSAPSLPPPPPSESLPTEPPPTTPDPPTSGDVPPPGLPPPVPAPPSPPAPEPRTRDNDSDGDPDTTDFDDDNDGLRDDEEFALGTDPLNPDTDNDGVTDRQEVLDGTNPLDRGSYRERLERTVCVEWDTLLGVRGDLELTNNSRRVLTLEVVFSDTKGGVTATETTSIKPNSRKRISLYDLTLRPRVNGRNCVTHNGEPGDLSARLVYSRSGRNSRGRGVSRNQTVPVSGGKSGPQHLIYSVHQPELLRTKLAAGVTNRIEVKHLGVSRVASGTMNLYRENGELVHSERIILRPQESATINATRSRGYIFGIAEWVPDDDTEYFSLRNIRSVRSHAGRFGTQVNGRFGSGDVLAVPVDLRAGSAVLEIANTTGTATSALVHLFAHDGELLELQEFTLPGHGSTRIVLDPSFAIAKRGKVHIDGAHRESIIADITHYVSGPNGKAIAISVTPAQVE